MSDAQMHENYGRLATYNIETNSEEPDLQEQVVKDRPESPHSTPADTMDQVSLPDSERAALEELDVTRDDSSFSEAEKMAERTKRALEYMLESNDEKQGNDVRAHVVIDKFFNDLVSTWSKITGPIPAGEAPSELPIYKLIHATNEVGRGPVETVIPLMSTPKEGTDDIIRWRAAQAIGSVLYDADWSRMSHAGTGKIINIVHSRADEESYCGVMTGLQEMQTEVEKYLQSRGARPCREMIAASTLVDMARPPKILKKKLAFHHHTATSQVSSNQQLPLGQVGTHGFTPINRKRRRNGTEVDPQDHSPQALRISYNKAKKSRQSKSSGREWTVQEEIAVSEAFFGEDLRVDRSKTSQFRKTGDKPSSVRREEAHAMWIERNRGTSEAWTRTWDAMEQHMEKCRKEGKTLSGLKKALADETLEKAKAIGAAIEICSANSSVSSNEKVATASPEG